MIPNYGRNIFVKAFLALSPEGISPTANSFFSLPRKNLIEFSEKVNVVINVHFLGVL